MDRLRLVFFILAALAAAYLVTPPSEVQAQTANCTCQDGATFSNTSANECQLACFIHGGVQLSGDCMCQDGTTFSDTTANECISACSLIGSGHGGVKSFGPLQNCNLPITGGGSCQCTCDDDREFSVFVDAANANAAAFGCTASCQNWGGYTDSGCVPSIPGVTPALCIDEPTVGWTDPAVLPADPMRGYADLHVHMFGHLAHGGRSLWGEPYHPVDHDNNPATPPALSDPTAALRECSGVHGHNHGFFGLGDVLGIGNSQHGIALPNGGAPGFSGWPRWNSITHQQVYYKWLERAWRGGLRLMTMLAVTNEALCKAAQRSGKVAPGVDCEDSMFSIDKQIEETYDFQAWLDRQSGGPGKGWFRIVKTAQEAQNVIMAGNLAVVLGIEVDNLFNCKFDDVPLGTPLLMAPTVECNLKSVRNQLQKYYDKGVRHIFPIHNFDNAYGGPATWMDPINAGNYVSENRFLDGRACPAVQDDGGTKSYGFKLDEEAPFTFLNLGFGINLHLEQMIELHYPDAPSCNSVGLRELGNFMVQEMMSKGMIIDIDHMSNHSFDRVLDLAERYDYPAIVASHVLFFDLSVQEKRHERMRTLPQIQRIKGLGGMIAPMLKDDQQENDPEGKYTRPYGPIADTCRRSSRTWAHAYQFAVDLMANFDGAGNMSTTPGIAFGSDFNGIAGHVGPRFGPEGCGGNETEKLNQDPPGLQYPFTLNGFGTFDKQVTGQRTFDFNTDGLAHVGMLPDLIADLKTIGVPEDIGLAPLFNSAKAYVEMWKKAEAAGVPSLSPDPVVAKCKDTTAETTISSCRGFASIDDGSHRPDGGPVVISQTPGAQGLYGLGTTHATLTVIDAADDAAYPGHPNQASCEADVTVVDKSGPPFIKCPSDIQAECVNGKGSVFDFTTDSLRFAIGNDACTQTNTFLGCVDEAGNSVISAGHQVASIEMDLGSSLPLTCKAGDGGGNVSSCPVNVKVTDLSPPQFAISLGTVGIDGCSTGEFVECEGREIDGQWVQGGTLTKSFTATDRCDGSITATCQKQGGEPGDAFFVKPATDANGPTVDALGGTLECKATDRAGLSKTCTTPVTVQDTQNAQITCPAGPVEIDCTGSGGATVALATLQDPVTASDACRGPLPDSSIQCYLGQFDFLNTPRTFPLGETSVTCRANDLYDAQFAHTHSWVSCPLTVKVVDTEKPTFTTSCPDNITTTATGPGGADASWPAVQASDSCSGVNVTCDHAPGTFPVGNTQVACVATDTSMNSNTCSFNVQVSYPFTGFAQPVDAAPTLNVAKGGAGIPVKFGLGGNFGLNIFAAGYPKSQQITCDSAAALNVVESTVTAGNSGLSYDTITDQYTYVWKTDKAWGGTCRQLTMKLADGTDKVAYFKLK